MFRETDLAIKLPIVSKLNINWTIPKPKTSLNEKLSAVHCHLDMKNFKACQFPSVDYYLRRNESSI